MIHNLATCKLGKGPAVHPKGMRMLAELTTKLPSPPPAVGWYTGAPVTTGGPALPAVKSWPVFLNNDLGDCTIAGIAHLIQLWNILTGSPFSITDADVLKEYSRLCGYIPGDPNTDQGGVESDLLSKWQSSGIFGHKIDGFVGVNPKSLSQMKDAIWLFGGVYLGIELPLSAQNQTIWDVPPGGPVGDGEPGSWGGHCTLGVALDNRYMAMVTWGSIQLATIEWISTYCSEAYAILSPDWINKSCFMPGGVPLASLLADLKRISVS